MVCCKNGDSGWLTRHNKIQQALAGFARKQGLAVDQNVRKSFEDSQIMTEPDLILYFSDGALCGDVSVVEPVAPSNVRSNDNVGEANWTAGRESRTANIWPGPAAWALTLCR